MILCCGWALAYTFFHLWNRYVGLNRQGEGWKAITEALLRTDVWKCDIEQLKNNGLFEIVLEITDKIHREKSVRSSPFMTIF